MTANNLESITRKYCPRFGQLAIEMGFVTEDQLAEALRCQLEDARSGKTYHLIGRILFDKDWMTGDQIEQVLNTLLKKMREEETDHSADMGQQH